MYLPLSTIGLTAITTIAAITATCLLRRTCCRGKGSEAKAKTIQNLPNKLSVLILQKLSNRDLLTFPRVCKDWQKLAQEIVFPEGFKFNTINQDMIDIIQAYPLNNIHIHPINKKGQDSLKNLLKFSNENLSRIVSFTADSFYNTLDVSKWVNLKFFKANTINCWKKGENGPEEEIFDFSNCSELEAFDCNDVSTPINLSQCNKLKTICIAHMYCSIDSLPCEQLESFEIHFHHHNINVKFSNKLTAFNCTFNSLKNNSTIDLSACTGLKALNSHCYKQESMISIKLPKELPDLKFISFSRNCFEDSTLVQLDNFQKEVKKKIKAERHQAVYGVYIN